MYRYSRVMAVFVAFGVVFASACSDPCMDLSKQICACETSMVNQQSCDLRVEAEAEDRDPTEEQKAACEKYLESCTCEKLAAGEMQACGLAP